MRQTLAHAQLGLITLITIAFLWATMPQSAQAAQAENIPLCHVVALPGAEHTLNPKAPKDERIQERGKVCDFILHVNGKTHSIEPIPPVVVPPAPPHIV